VLKHGIEIPAVTRRDGAPHDLHILKRHRRPVSRRLDAGARPLVEVKPRTRAGTPAPLHEEEKNLTGDSGSTDTDTDAHRLAA
jgi:hypothetical protein